MKEIAEILKFTLPSLVFFATVWFFADKLILLQREKIRNEVHLKNVDIITPLKLQAYERFVLLLERINPENLILRINNPGYTSGQMHNELLTSIRAEFEHNFSQQIYISVQAWEMVKGARTNVVQIINTCAEKIKPDSPAISLSTAILGDMMKNEQYPVSDAILFLKNELNTII